MLQRLPDIDMISPPSNPGPRTFSAAGEYPAAAVSAGWRPPFTNVLTEGIIAQALTAMNVCWVDRIYSPLVTL